MKEAGGRECEESRVKDRRTRRSNEIEGRCESDRLGDEVYSATFGNEEKTGSKLDRRKRHRLTLNTSTTNLNTTTSFHSYL